MLIQSERGVPMFKYWSPMSIGSWAVMIFGLFAFLSFLAALAEVDMEMARGLDAAATESKTLDELVSKLIETLAEVLKKHSAILRPLMLRATFDEVVAKEGKRSYAATEQQFRQLLLNRSKEIHHPDPERAVRSVFRIVYAAFARYLGFGSSTTAAWEGDWQVLKEDLEVMSSAFLRHGARD